MTALIPILILQLLVTSDIQDPEPVSTDQPAKQEEKYHVVDPASLLGQSAPSLILDDIDGKSFDLAAHSDEIVVLEWTLPECRFSRRLYGQHRILPMARRWAKEGVKWVSIDAAFFAHPEKIRIWVEKYSVKHPYLIDKAGTHAEAFGVSISPTYVVVNRGQIVYHGALDDDVWGKKLERALYLDTAIRETVAGKAVGSSLTRPYGMQIRTRRVEDERRAQIEKARQEQTDQKDAGSQKTNSTENER